MNSKSEFSISSASTWKKWEQRRANLDQMLSLILSNWLKGCLRHYRLLITILTLFYLIGSKPFSLASLEVATTKANTASRKTRTAKSWWPKWWPLFWNQLRIKRCIKHILTLLSLLLRLSRNQKTLKWWSLCRKHTKICSRSSLVDVVRQLIVLTSNSFAEYLRNATLNSEKAWWNLFWDTCSQTPSMRDPRVWRASRKASSAEEPKLKRRPKQALLDPTIRDSWPSKSSILLLRHLRKTTSFWELWPDTWTSLVPLSFLSWERQTPGLKRKSRRRCLRSTFSPNWPKQSFWMAISKPNLAIKFSRTEPR